MQVEGRKVEGVADLCGRRTAPSARQSVIFVRTDHEGGAYADDLKDLGCTLNAGTVTVEASLAVALRLKVEDSKAPQ